MNVVVLSFSPTGGTGKVAKILASELAQQCSAEACREVDLADPSFNASEVEIASDDFAVIAVPSFGGRVPALAAERLSAVKGSGAQAAIVCVYGNRAYEDTLVELQDVAVAAGFSVVAAVAAIAEHSIAHVYAAGRPDAADEAELRTFADRIAEAATSAKGADSERSVALDLPGNRPYKKASAAGMVPKATKACVGCGACAEACPARAIDPSDPHKVDSKKCISCMRCISVCPHDARENSKVMLFAVRMALKKACSDRKPNELFV